MCATSLLIVVGLAITNADALAGNPAVEAAPAVLTLDSALKLVEENNVDLQVARERLGRAQILSSKAWAYVLPVLAANASITRNNTEIVFPLTLPGMPPQEIVIQKLYTQNASATLNWTLLSGRTVPLLQNAYTAVDVAELGYEQMMVTMRHATSLVYYGVLNADRQVDIRRRALALAQEHKRLADAQVSVGEATQVIALRSDVEVTTAEQALLQAENAASLSHLSLATLLGSVRDDGTYPAYVVARPPERAPVARGNDLIARAHTHRLDLKTRRLELTMAERSKFETWMQFLPALVATGSYRWSDAAGFSGEKTNWQAGLALQWQIFEGGSTFWQLQERQHDINTALLTLDKARQDITQQVLESQLNLGTAEASYRVAQRRAELARQSAVLVKAQYEVGAATQLDLLDANRTLADAETAEALGQLAVDMANMQLEQVLRVPLGTTAPSSADTGM